MGCRKNKVEKEIILKIFWSKLTEWAFLDIVVDLSKITFFGCILKTARIFGCLFETFLVQFKNGLYRQESLPKAKKIILLFSEQEANILRQRIKKTLQLDLGFRFRKLKNFFQDTFKYLE